MDKICQAYQEQFGLESMETHLAEHGRDCPLCRTFAARQRALQQVLPTWTTPETSPDFERDVMASIAEWQSNRSVLRSLFDGFLSYRVPVPVPIGLGLIALFCLSLYYNVQGYVSASSPGGSASVPMISHNPEGGESLPEIRSPQAQAVICQPLPSTLDAILPYTGGVGMIIVIPPISMMKNGLTFPMPLHSGEAEQPL